MGLRFVSGLKGPSTPPGEGQTLEGLQVQERELHEFVKEAIRRSLVLVVVVVPFFVVCWRASERLSLGALTLGIYVAVAGLLIVCEYTLAYNEEWGMAIKGNLTDFVYVATASLTEKATLFLCAAAAAAFGSILAEQSGVSPWPSAWPFVLQVVLALFIADVGTYFRHRLFHRYPALWRLHQIHHSATGLYWIRSAYTHPLVQFAIMLAIMFPIALLGASGEVIVVVAFVYGLSGLIQHANIDAHSSILNCIFATPEVHRFHHGANEIGNASNYSAFFVFMDMLFGTYRHPDRHEAPRLVGLLGVKTFPGSFLAQLVLPFQRNPAGLQLDDTWVPSSAGVRGADESVVQSVIQNDGES
jgi:sterol desaturase/sphingolipid hydroxylase (fatty acid hydroxylase superfamily)